MKFDIETLEPITDNGRIIWEAYGFVLKNTGQQTVIIEDLYPLEPGESLQFVAPVTMNEVNQVDLNAKITFTGVGTKELSILTFINK